MNETIDFVVTWVDPSDPEWKKEFRQYAPLEKVQQMDMSDERYRDWGLLKYWFRGVEQFAPWVRYIHFVTCGHVPDWLDLSNPKLKIVKHEDYIPNHYLPVFNSNAIEMMMHRIPNLAEHFVYFNDDNFLTRPVSSDYFFHNEVPCDMAVISIKIAAGIMGGITKQNMSIINKEFNVFRSVLTHPRIWFQPSYKKYLTNTLRGLSTHTFNNPGDTHGAIPYRRSTWEAVWAKYGSVFEETLGHRFRTAEDHSHWVYRYWQIMEGNIEPRDILHTTKVYYDIFGRIDAVCQALTNQQYQVTVINDTPGESNVEEAMSRLIEAFQQICPKKSSFEK